MAGLTISRVVPGRPEAHLPVIETPFQTGRTMTALRTIRTALDTIRAAIRAAAATEMHRMPAAADLKTLGIPQSAFRTIHL
jgi:hypothetical protein